MEVFITPAGLMLKEVNKRTHAQSENNKNVIHSRDDTIPKLSV